MACAQPLAKVKGQLRIRSLLARQCLAEFLGVFVLMVGRVIGEKKEGRRMEFLAPPGIVNLLVLLSSSGCPTSFSCPSYLCPPHLLRSSPTPHFHPCPFPSYLPSLSLLFLSFSAFLPSLLIFMSVHLCRSLPLPSQALSPVDPPGSLFRAPCSSPSLSPPASHSGGCGPGCHQWRNQRQLLHHVSGWLSGGSDCHLRGW